MTFIPSRSLDQDVADAADDGLKGICERIAAEARSNTPAATGKARESIRVGKSEHGWYVKGGGGDAYYFVFIEYGAYSNPGLAPLRRAAESVGNLERNRR